MNVERWVNTRRPSWEKLEELLRLVDQSGVSKLDRQQLQELGRLYRTASADLSRARAAKLGQNVLIFLNNLVVRAHNQVYQTKRNRWGDLVRYLLVGFPSCVRANFGYVFVAFLMTVIPMSISFAMTVKDNQFAQLEMVKGQPLVPEQVWSSIEKKKMWTDSAQDNSPAVSSLLSTNNIKVSINAFVLGITYGIGTVLLLAGNGLHLGAVFGLCYSYGMLHSIGTFISGHGVFELLAIFISGGAGLMLGKALLLPGQYRRVDALRIGAKTAGSMFGGCIGMLLIAALIEAFISPRTDLAPEAKMLVSLATAMLLILYFGFAGQNGDRQSSSKSPLAKLPDSKAAGAR